MMMDSNIVKEFVNLTSIDSRAAPRGRRLLLVDDYEGVRITMEEILKQNGFDVVTASNVPDALRLCCTEKFDVLLCDLHMPRPGDGFIVIGAMRHCNPEAVNVIYSGFPALHAAMADILLQADEVLVKPLVVPDLISMLNQRLSKERNEKRRPVPGDSAESVATLLKRETENTIADWLKTVKANPELMAMHLPDAERTAHLPRLFADLVYRLVNMRPVDDKHPLDLPPSNPISAQVHGALRRKQGYTAALIVEESRMLQVSIFKTLQANLSLLDFSHILIAVMAIADEVDAQLKNVMDSYVESGINIPVRSRTA
jgi:CheY-like chemotaxis protein